jgi:hypothetical protein
MNYLEINCSEHFKRLSINFNYKPRGDKVEVFKVYVGNNNILIKINNDQNWTNLPINIKAVYNSDLQITNAYRFIKFIRLAMHLL